MLADLLYSAQEVMLMVSTDGAKTMVLRQSQATVQGILYQTDGFTVRQDF